MQLLWDNELGYGHYPVDLSTNPYNEDYFNRYADYEGEALTDQLNDARWDFVKGIPSLLDVGIGAGTFIKNARNNGCNAFGYDVNPVGVKWLKERALYREPDQGLYQLGTFWDSFEHIPRPDKAVKNMRQVAMSIPIFRDREHALSSKHFRTDEHIWYFTQWGLMGYMGCLGFETVRIDDFETKLGREGIKSFYFSR